MLQVVIVVLMLESLTLEADATIGGACVEYQAIQPLHKVEDVEEDIPKLLHLCRVDILMVVVVRSHLVRLTHKANTKEVDCLKTLKGYLFVVNYSHSSIL